MNEDIKMEEGKLYFGEHQVHLHSNTSIKKLEDVLKQTRFGIRVKGNSMWEWCIGLDVVEDGKLFWLNAFPIDRSWSKFMPETLHWRFSGIERILNDIHPTASTMEWRIVEDALDDTNMFQKIAENKL